MYPQGQANLAEEEVVVEARQRLIAKAPWVAVVVVVGAQLAQLPEAPWQWAAEVAETQQVQLPEAPWIVRTQKLGSEGNSKRRIVCDLGAKYCGEYTNKWCCMNTCIHVDMYACVHVRMYSWKHVYMYASIPYPTLPTLIEPNLT